MITKNPIITLADGTEALTLRQAEAEGLAALSTLRSWVNKGVLPTQKFEGIVYVTREDIAALKDPSTAQRVLDLAVERLVSRAPQLTPDQRRRLALAVIAA